MPDNNLVTFDISDCTLREQSDEHSAWSNADGVYIVLRTPTSTTKWPFALHDIDAATRYFSQQSVDNGGALLHMEAVTLCGQTGLKGLFKYRSPLPESMGMMYVGILWMQLHDRTIQINVESIEQGDTGLREAAVGALTSESQASSAAQEPVLVDSVEELFALMHTDRLRLLPSDDKQYDAMFPDHPLSKVRRRMTQLAATLSIVAKKNEPAGQTKTPRWKFW